jgi:hypothetical protein
MIRGVGTHVTLYARRDAATHKRRRPSPEKSQAGAADGFAILEVVVAFTMLVIILIPAAALFSTVIRVSANARNRVEASNLAAQQIDIGRATSFGTLAAQASDGTVQTGTAKEGGITFTIAQSASWVNESTNACGGTGNGAPGTQPVLAMTETVTWPNMGSTHPVVAQTDIAPPAGYYSNSMGNLAVDVVDSNGAPVVGASVTVTGPTNAGPILTGTTGCAFAAFLSPGAYAVSASLPGYVDMDENLTATKSNLAIGAGSTVGWTLNYAPAAQVPISYTSTAAQMPPPTTTTTVAPTTTTTLAGPTTTTSSTTTTSAPAGTTTTTTPPGTVTYPTNGYPVTVNDAAYLPAPVTYSAPLAGALPLWPYSNGYDIYPGGCADNDPVAYSTYTPFTVSQGVTSPDTLQVYGVSITATSAAGPVTSLQVTATDTSGTCSAPNNGFSFGTVGGNSTVIAIPLGTFSLAITGTANGVTVKGTLLLPQETGSPLPPQNVTLS